MSSDKDILFKIISAIEQQWNIFETYLYAPKKLPDFEGFLSHYRGLSPPSQYISKERKEHAQTSALGVVQFFSNIFLLNGLAELGNEQIQELLLEIEKTVNLSLYYWFGSNDRNFQFRTWIHYFSLEGASLVFLKKEDLEFSILLSEEGIRFGLVKEKCFPQIKPVSKLFLSCGHDDSAVFARLRTLQREICLLVDEWEYANSILAVEYAQSMSLAQNFKSEETIQAHDNILLKMNSKRIFSAKFGLESICDFQEWVNTIYFSNKNKDIIAEIDAVCSLILSSVQKFFLPASMSRLAYDKDVLLLFHRFFLLRLTYCPEDYSAALTLQVLQRAQGQPIQVKLFDILEVKSYEWKFCFDPSAALKAFCWTYSQIEQTIFAALMGICYFKKCYSNHVDENKLLDLVSTFDIHSQFVSYLEISEPKAQDLSLVADWIVKLKEIFLKYMETHIKKTHAVELDMLTNYLGAL